MTSPEKFELPPMPNGPMRWRVDFPWSEEYYAMLEVKLEALYQVMCAAHVLITPLTMTQWSGWHTNHLVTESWLNQFHGD